MVSRSAGVAVRISNFTRLQVGIHAFAQITREIGRIRFLQHMFDPGRALERLQRQVPNADGGVQIARGRKISTFIITGKKYPVKKLVLVSPEIDKDKCSIASIVCPNESEIKIVRLKFP